MSNIGLATLFFLIPSHGAFQRIPPHNTARFRPLLHIDFSKTSDSFDQIDDNSPLETTRTVADTEGNNITLPIIQEKKTKITNLDTTSTTIRPGQLFTTSTSNTSSSSKSGISNLDLGTQEKRRNNILIALSSVALALINYLYQYTHPLTSLQILSTLQSQSPPITAIGANGKPTVVDFWAPWCENCKFFAPTMNQIHAEYGDKVNFVMINADDASSWNIIETFGVDAIPHMAFVDREGSVETALVGIVSGNAIRRDLDGLLNGEGVTVKGYDAFLGRDRVVKFEEVRPAGQ